MSHATVLDSLAKETLRREVRALRGKLVDELSDAAEAAYQLSLSSDKAQLGVAAARKRAQLEDWIGQQLRATVGAGAAGGANGKAAKAPKADKATRLRYLRQAVQEAAHTLLHRVVLLRMLEHHGLSQPQVVAGGWNSPGYKEFSDYAGPLGQDETRGYQALLDTVFAELALELPALFGPVGLVGLFPIPAATLRDLVNTLDDKALASAWGDDTTLGWVYQYWNDPDREDLDKKIAGGGKIEPHEIASKTQMFTERYMVEWLLQNSLGLSWLAVCEKNGWQAEADQVLPELEARRAAFRAQREAGEVALDALMPIAPGLEERWKYYVPQPLPAGAVQSARSSVREIKLLDPACGSGHFLVIAFDLLAAMYEEEARHRGETWSAAQIAQWIVSENLHGIDIDPRATQIAAAALWLKAKRYAPEAVLGRLNLVAPTLRLGELPESDPALQQLAEELEQAAGIAKPITLQLVKALSGVDYLGSLLRVDQAAEEALKAAGDDYEQAKGWQGDLLVSGGFRPLPPSENLAEAKLTVLDKLEHFLAQHSASEDLGVRLGGEQLAAGARFVRLAREGTYDVVVGNPPYQGLSKTKNFDYVQKHYPRGKADLYAAFLERGLELVREGGISALVTMRGWMFLGQFKELRKGLLENEDLRGIVDLDSGAFDEVSAAQVVLSVACSIFRRGAPEGGAVAVRPTPTEDRASQGMTDRKRAGLLAQVGRYEFDPKGFAVIEGEPIVYWWTKEFLERYAKAPKLGDVAGVHLGISTGDNTRFIRYPWEPGPLHVSVVGSNHFRARSEAWAPTIKGADGSVWIEPLARLVNWRQSGLEMWASEASAMRSPHLLFVRGNAFTPIGATFSARMHRYESVMDATGRSVFSTDLTGTLLAMNSDTACRVMEAFNPTVSFTAGDVARMPVFQQAQSGDVFDRIETAFTEHESHREPSVEFRSPGPSPWRYAQAWAQLAVDRPDNTPLPDYVAEYDPPDPAAHVSFAIGVALGRFSAAGAGILNPEDAPPNALPAGILFVGPDDGFQDSLSGLADHTGAKASGPLAASILSAWDTHQLAILDGKRATLREWLRKDFFGYHKALYENRPIYLPLSSDKKSFVAWVSIHRWDDRTLQTLLADHLHPILRKLDGELNDLAVARHSSDKKTARAAEQRYAAQKRLRDELGDFADAVSQCAERGAPPTDASCPPRAADAPFVMDLDDGVMINSAALWPLLAPQWKDPAKWWKQLCQAAGKKDYDWAHLSRRYFPARVEDKCKVDPSLAVAHGCFWKYHPAKAYAWELRLQHEIKPEFTIDEEGSDAAREAFLAQHPAEADVLLQKEQTRRDRVQAKLDAEDADSEAGADEDGEGDANDNADEEADE